MKGVVIFLCFVVVLLSGLTTYQFQEGQEAHEALCAFTVDLQARHDNTVQFLKDNPGDFVLGNVPRETLEASLANQAATLVSLDGLTC